MQAASKRDEAKSRRRTKLKSEASFHPSKDRGHELAIGEVRPAFKPLTTSLTGYSQELAAQRMTANHERRAILDCTRSPVTAAEWLDVLSRHNGKCLSCGSTDDITMDHIIPVKRGGPNTKDNVQPLCRSCNSSKGTKTIDYRPAVD